jgi:phosphoserine aminotransferase
MVTVYIFKQTKVFNFTKQQGGVIKIQKQNQDMFHNLTPYLPFLYLIN